MRKQDIEVGKVYAYKERPSSWVVEQIVFLAPLDSANIYTYASRSDSRATAGDISKSTTYDKPRSMHHYPDHGYLVAIGSDVSGATREEGRRSKVGWHDTEKGYRYQILARTQQAYGPDYATFKARLDAQREAEQAERQAVQKARDERDSGLEAARERLREFGIHAANTLGHLQIQPEGAAKLKEVLDRLGAPHGV
jgi:hypothetical protein